MLQALNTDNSPFDAQQLVGLKAAIDGLDAAQSQWLSGYLAGRLAAVPAPSSATEPVLTVLFGSETGNGEAVANALAERLRSQGQAIELKSMDGYRVQSLARLRHAVFVISTHGEGDPPEEAMDLFEALTSARAPQLGELSFRILALGDRSYERFCQAGIELEQRLEALGATAFGPRIDCDVNYAAEAANFSDAIADWVKTRSPGPAPAAGHLSLVPDTARWTREQPFEATVLDAHPLTDEGSVRDVHHIELSLAEGGFAYEPGDALGVWAPNDSSLTERLLQLTGLSADRNVIIDGVDQPLVQALTHHRELTRLTPDTVRAWASFSADGDLAETFNALDAAGQRAFIEQRQLLDLAEGWPANPAAQALVDALRPLAPRSYSIASSRALVDDEVHLTVSTLSSDAGLGQRHGVASHHLNHGLAPGDSVRVFLEPNRRFRLPDDPEAPLVWIGAGTGIAPFRAFAQALEARGQSPETWLIFGNPHQHTDFLYQREWLQWRRDGLLNRIDAAWSRDQAEKRYVQHIVREKAPELLRWLERGAHLYLCGALAMGEAVQQALLDGLAEARGDGHEAANEAWAEWRRAQRIHKDLY